MIIPLTEPSASRYIYINPENNQVHLLVPLVGGQEISTDNTCKSTLAFDEFFDGAALRELNAYKAALEFDLQLLGNDNLDLSETKNQRLTQINTYISLISTPIRKRELNDIITGLKQVRSNLYSIQLRPSIQDPVSPVVNPVFNINRTIDATGTPLSALYNALYAAFPNVNIAPINPRKRLEDVVMAGLQKQPIEFNAIQQALTDQCQHLFGLTVDFTRDKDGAEVRQASMDALMGFTPTNPATTQDYIDALLGACALNVWESIPTSPFYNEQQDDQTEKLSILTQFFLAHVNVYCAEHDISHANFGVILDASSNLSNKVAEIIVTALGAGADVEERLCTFFNEHATEFGLTRHLSSEDTQAIKQRFLTNYATVKDSAHFDDFMILNTATDTGIFVTHQGSICTDFSELVSPGAHAFFNAVRTDFEAPKSRFIPHQNEHIQASIHLEIDDLASRVTNDEQLKLFDLKTRHRLNTSPDFQSRLFLHYVAKGQQNDAERQLEVTEVTPDAASLLLTEGRFTDYSGRTFECTAYEYAYWAKDKHMCRMLEKHMNEETKSAMLERIEAIERSGLTYEQQGQVKNSKHFDLMLDSLVEGEPPIKGPLLQALQNFVDGHDAWADEDDDDAIQAARMRIGLAQRDLPVHVINEYCRTDRSFSPIPEFNEDTLPRDTIYVNHGKGALFPLTPSATSGLGVDFTLCRGSFVSCLGASPEMSCDTGFRDDLMAIIHLDEVRTADLAQSRENLGLIKSERRLVS
jgi:hypothetical protein